MKKFFKNKLNIALVCISLILIICILLSRLWSVFVSITLLVGAILCFYLSYYVYYKLKQKADKEVTEFFEDDEAKQNKKPTFSERESKISSSVFVYGLIIFGVVFIYLFIKTI